MSNEACYSYLKANNRIQITFQMLKLVLHAMSIYFNLLYAVIKITSPI